MERADVHVPFELTAEGGARADGGQDEALRLLPSWHQGRARDPAGPITERSR